MKAVYYDCCEIQQPHSHIPFDKDEHEAVSELHAFLWKDCTQAGAHVHAISPHPHSLAPVRPPITDAD